MKLFNFNIVLNVLSRVLLLSGIFLLTCIPVALYFKEEYNSFLISSFISLLLGITLYLLTGIRKDELKRREAYLTVTLSWFVISLVGTLPYIISQTIPHFTDALFESVSGFTTTGSSILTDIEALPKSILFWRSLTHWIGGLGIIVLVIIIMPSLKIGSYQLFTSESSLREKIHPRMKAVGSRLLLIYISLTFIQVILMCIGGMSLYESLCHAFGTVATGGFSPKNTSIAGYSPYIQYVTMIFMFLAGTNFVIHYFIIKAKFKKILSNDEFWFYLFSIVFSGLFVSVFLYLNSNFSFEKSFRDAFFQVISIITCTGFATADYLLWPGFLWIFIFALMFLGGSTGSTAGGIKMARHLMFLKSIRENYKKLIHPHMVSVVRLNGNVISEENRLSIKTFISWYILVFIMGTFLLILTGIDGKTAAGAAITTMGGIGPGIGTVGPASNFAHLPEVGKMILILLMLLGRLELYTILILFTPAYWKA
ncbi:MAG TPA: TrkH family potassium uptake protein [Bacteroidales bacterium]|nr:TrkH family potassium uptake protein [Bacteroidales bacterium]